MLFDARGNLIPVSNGDSTKDPRTEQMKEFDRRLRLQMQDNGGQYFPPRMIEKLKSSMAVRDMINEQDKLRKESERTRMDDMGDNVLEEARRQSKKQVIT